MKKLVFLENLETPVRAIGTVLRIGVLKLAKRVSVLELV